MPGFCPGHQFKEGLKEGNGLEMEEIVKTLAGHSIRLDNLERWQESQNGSIHKVRDEVNEIRKWIMRATLGVALNLLSITATAVFLYLKVVH